MRPNSSEAGQLAACHGSAAQQPRPDGYIVPACRAFPFALNAADVSAGYWLSDQA